MKVPVDGDSKEILGANVLGTGGDDVIHCVLDLMCTRAPYSVMQRAVPIHPTTLDLVMVAEHRGN
jgi:pyruvate/2-oxoglutarate dehydrogenase complex dihydrolipoamide dehydrogenase (E3) component